MKKNTIIIGAGKLGCKLAKELTDKNENVLVIDKSKIALTKLDDYCGFTLCGDATDLDILNKANIEECNSVIICTNNDNVNVFLADVCYHIYHVENVYVRLSDADREELIKNTPITAIYPFKLSVDYFFEQKEKNAK